MGIVLTQRSLHALQLCISSFDSGTQFVQAHGIGRRAHQHLHLLLTHVQVVLLEFQVLYLLRQVGKLALLLLSGLAAGLHVLNESVAPAFQSLRSFLYLFGRGDESLTFLVQERVLSCLLRQFLGIRQFHPFAGRFL